MSAQSTAAAFLLSLVLVSPGRTLQPTPEARERQTVEDLERHWLAVEDDPSALESVLAEDFVHVLPSGFVTKRQQLDFMRTHARPNDPASKRFEDLRVRVYGSAAIATGIVVATAPDGTVRKTIFTDVFANRNGRWQAVNAQELPMSGGPSR